MRTERRAKRGWRAGLFALRPMVGRSDLDIDFLRWAVSRTRRGLRVICMNGSRRAETCRWACPSGERGYARSMRTGHFSMTCVDALIWGSGLHGGAHVAVRSAGNRSYASWEGGEQAARHGKKLGDRFAVILQMEQKAENEAVRARGPRGFRDPTSFVVSGVCEITRCIVSLDPALSTIRDKRCRLSRKRIETQSAIVSVGIFISLPSPRYRQNRVRCTTRSGAEPLTRYPPSPMPLRTHAAGSIPAPPVP